MRKYLLTYMAWIAFAVAFAQTDAEKFATGTEAYQNAEWQSAINAWSDMSARSVAVEYNLGNAFYQLGELGKSILHYERALKHNPSDADVRNNLALAQEGRIDAFEEVPEPIYQTVGVGFLMLLSLQTWTVLALSLFVIAALAFLVVLFQIQWRKSGLVVFVASLLLGLLFLGFAYARYNHVDAVKEWLVVVPNVYVKSGPQESATDVFIIHEGTKARELEAFEAWVKLRMPDGKIGWAPATALEQI